MPSSTDPKVTPFVESVSDAQTDLIKGAAEIARQTINGYFTGIKILADQQRFASRAFQQSIAEVANAQVQLMHRLIESYSAANNEVVKTYEKAFNQPGLQRLVSSPAHEPLPGYDELNVQEIQRLLAGGDVELAARVRDYERRRKSREGVLHAADAQLNKS
jgi:hypothetical protein